MFFIRKGPSCFQRFQVQHLPRIIVAVPFVRNYELFEDCLQELLGQEINPCFFFFSLFNEKCSTAGSSR